MYIRKIHRTGHALAVSLPKIYLRKLKVEHGEWVKIELSKNSKNYSITITPLKKEWGL